MWRAQFSKFTSGLNHDKVNVETKIIITVCYQCSGQNSFFQTMNVLSDFFLLVPDMSVLILETLR